MKSKYVVQGIAFIAVFLIVVSLSFGIFSESSIESNLEDSELIENSANVDGSNSADLKENDKELANNSI